MQCYLAITPKEAQQLRDCPLPRVHIAYVIDEGGHLARSAPPTRLRGGLMGLSDRCKRQLMHTDALLRTIMNECAQRQFDGVLADFEPSALTDRVVLLDRLGALLKAQGKALYTPQYLAVPSGRVLVSTAISGGSLREMLQGVRSRYGAQRTALDVQRLMMEFPLPCLSGQGTPLTLQALNALKSRREISVFYSRDLGAHYFTYAKDGQTRFVLFDDAQTLRAKLTLGEQLGFPAAFFMYPEVKDLLPALFGSGKQEQ